MSVKIKKDLMFYRFALYGFLKNLRFFDPFILLFLRDSGMSYFQIGLLYAIRDLSTNVLEIPTGVYADAFGRRRSMVMAFLAYIISFIIFYLFRNFYLFALAMIFFAFGDAFRTGTHKALILEYLKIKGMSDLKVAYYGRTRAASQLGSAVNSLLAAALVFYSGNYRYIFIATTFPYVLDLINVSTYPKELDGELVQLRKGAIGEQVRKTVRSFLAIFADQRAMRAILNSSGFDAFFKVTKEYLQPVLKALAVELPLLMAIDADKRAAVLIGLVYFVLYLLTSYASRSAASFSSRFANLPRAINVTYLIGAVFLFIAGASTALQWSIISVLVFVGFYVLHNLRRPMNVAMISDQIPHRVMAAGLSAESQFTTLLMVILSPIMGALADHLGVGAALACLGGVMLVAAYWVRVEAPQPSSEGAAA